MEAALRLIDASGSAESVTLRAVARETGISAPSIYPHYRDRAEIMSAVNGRIFEEIRDAITAARDEAGPEPDARLIAVCACYVSFGLSSPSRYRALFACLPSASDDSGATFTLTDLAKGEGSVGAEAFRVLVGCLEECRSAGLSTSKDTTGDAVAIWLFVHGMVSLHHGVDKFPWPSTDDLLRKNVGRLAGLGTTRPTAHGRG